MTNVAADKSCSIKCYLLGLLFCHLLTLTSMEMVPRADMCLGANPNLTKAMSELSADFQEMKMKFAEQNQIILILQEQQIKLEQQQLQRNQKLLLLHEKQLVQLEQLERQASSQEIVILRRMDGSVDFFRTWNEYQRGFGHSSGEFFIGLDKLHQLTNSGPYELLIVLEDWEGERRYAKYDQFVVGAEKEQYKLHSLGRYTGTAGDDFTYNLGQKFTTKDRDNDLHQSANCAVLYRGAWWHRACYLCNLNGPYKQGRVDDSELGQIVQWHAFKGNVTSLKFAEMTIRLN